MLDDASLVDASMASRLPHRAEADLTIGSGNGRCWEPTCGLISGRLMPRSIGAKIVVCPSLHSRTNREPINGKKTDSKKPDSLIDQMKQRPLSFWGAVCIFSGIFSGLAMNLMIDAGNFRRAEERAVRLGSAVAGGLVVLAGIVLLVMHFVRRKRS